MDRSTGKKIALYASIGLVTAFAVVALRGFFEGLDAPGVFALLSDAFLVPAVLLAGFSALSWMKRGGEYDTLGYGVAQLKYRLPFVDKTHMSEGFYDYRTRKAKDRGAWEPYALWVAGAFGALMLLCLGIYFILGAGVAA